jgi:hypothetical protein
MRRACAILMLVLVGGCASLSEQECLLGDWRAIGFEDGTQGQPPTRIADHRDACARHGVSPNLDLWRLGYEEGLPLYCTRANGFRVGATGATYHGVCNGPGSGDFLKAMNDGGILYSLRQDRDHARSDIASLEDELDRLHDRREDAREDVKRPGIPDEERTRILGEIEEMSEDIGRLTSERDDAEYALGRIEANLRATESQLQRVYPEWRGY